MKLSLRRQQEYKGSNFDCLFNTYTLPVVKDKINLTSWEIKEYSKQVSFSAELIPALSDQSYALLLPALFTNLQNKFMMILVGIRVHFVSAQSLWNTFSFYEDKTFILTHLYYHITLWFAKMSQFDLFSYDIIFVVRLSYFI